ncbi:MAG: hypothetical protein HY898_24865 [Deltaproteobacteria bacterium]|nr:hypothetical protein [Deltaproteobacteria bacterium]
MANEDVGTPYTKGSSFRARAEARQRTYRAQTLAAGWKGYGHLLDDDALEARRNFITREAWQAARDRQAAGKGVAERTFRNMLSSQAMCFNIFATLQADPKLATRILCRLVPGLIQVQTIAFEYTPSNDVFGDQTGQGGVDCDLLIEGLWDGGPGILVMETKFVEPDFSICGFRKHERIAKSKPMCPEDVPVKSDAHACLYESSKHYLYWARSLEHDTLNAASVPEKGCPFGGELWQLWVNHTLAHVEARNRRAKVARYAVCAPASNNELLQGGEVLSRFRALVKDPSTVLFIDVDRLVDEILSASAGNATLAEWARGVQARYHRI